MSDSTKGTLTQLGADTPEKVAALFAELRLRFAKEDSDLSIVGAGNARDRWQSLHLSWLGRKSGVFTEITENWLKSASPELKKVVGQEFQKLKAHVEAALEEKRKEIEAQAAQSAAARNAIDLSLPGVERELGTRHLIRQTFEELQRIFLSIGFSVVEGPEIETPYYNFEALNIPEHHPARDNMDTFYIEGARGGHLLRTHTSPMQIRTMEKQPPPVRIVVPGRVYRRDNPDATHGYMFHQIEGLAVDTDITFCDFKGTVDYFAREFLGPKTKTRLRPSYFPFTEPSAEVDATCHVCGGAGCRVCKQSGWIELFGAGMVDPAVYGFVKYDAEKLSGFAFGMGVDRLAMLKYGVTELPVLFQNDVRFLRQFP
ncbi:MAG TPA: phenylalanine--tRNA ligase subunit alpha [Candidatus Acidoferrum sp.]|nr:phenylalanine--tRNA ligase subunit alpha [Candidatus Acidoferrum sp.]